MLHDTPERTCVSSFDHDDDNLLKGEDYAQRTICCSKRDALTISITQVPLGLAGEAVVNVLSKSLCSRQPSPTECVTLTGL